MTAANLDRSHLASTVPEGDACNDPAVLRVLLIDLLHVLRLQASEIERLTAHVEQQTDRLLQPTQMPLIVSELSELHARLSK